MVINLPKAIPFVNGIEVLTQISVSPNPWIFTVGASQGGGIPRPPPQITNTLFLLQELLFKVVLSDCTEAKLQNKSCATEASC